MAQTIDQIQADLRAQYPTITVDAGGPHLLASADYDATIATWARNILASQQEADAEAARKALRAQVRLALTTLDANHTALSGTGTLTVAQLRGMLDDVTRVTAGLISVLIDLKQIESG